MQSQLDVPGPVNVTHNDNAFGPQDGAHFDLTLLFENTILTILPTAILILISPLHLINHKKKSAVGGRSRLLWSKLVRSLRPILRLDQNRH